MARQLYILGSVLLTLFVIGGVVLYAYNYVTTFDAVPLPAPYIASMSEPDNSALGGTVQDKTANSITIVKQGGIVVTIGLASSTRVFDKNATSTGAASRNNIEVGKVVLITPMAANPSVADSIVIVTPPPAVSNQ
jgi:hypothetical protein